MLPDRILPTPEAMVANLPPTSGHFARRLASGMTHTGSLCTQISKRRCAYGVALHADLETYGRT